MIYIDRDPPLLELLICKQILAIIYSSETLLFDETEYVFFLFYILVIYFLCTTKLSLRHLCTGLEKIMIFSNKSDFFD